MIGALAASYRSRNLDRPVLAPESASTSGLAVVLPATSVGAGGTKDYTAYRVTVDGGKPIAVNTPEVWWTLGDNGNSATNGGKGWVRIFGRSVALGDLRLIDLAPIDRWPVRLEAKIRLQRRTLLGFGLQRLRVLRSLDRPDALEQVEKGSAKRRHVRHSRRA